MFYVRRLFRPLLALAAVVAAGLAAEPAPADPAFSVSKMDRSVDPRVDFSRYAAGGWYASAKIPADKSRWGTFNELEERNFAHLKVLLEEAASTPGAAGGVRQKVGDFYASALDTATIDRVGLGPVRGQLDAIAAAASTEALFLIAADMHLALGNPFFAVSSSPDQKQSDRYGLTIRQGGLSLPSKEYYFAEKFARERREFVAHIARVLELAGEAPAEARTHADAIAGLETALAENSKLPAELRDRIANYHKMTLAEAKAAYPQIPFGPFLDRLGIPAGTTHLVVGQPAFLAGLSKLLENRPLTEWKLYLRWHLLRASSPYLSAALEDESFRFFSTVLSGTPEQEPRWQRAARVVNAQIGEALGELYVQRHFPPAARARMAAMIEQLRAVFRDRLARLEWMSEPTRQKALAKFARFEPMIGYPDRWRDYSSVAIARGDFFGNVIRSTRFDSLRRFQRTGQVVDRREWSMTPPTVNAYYSPTSNVIVFPAGILQPPFFDVTKDDAVNYGAIGAVIGHEITHGFDDQGRKSDGDGNLVEWWLPEDAARFQERATRVVEQFNRYQALPGLAINGQLTLGENIGDLGGTSIAFEALQRSLRGAKPELIDGLTPQQRFFISWAQSWRTLYRDDALRRQVASNPHSPGQFRAFGPLVNQQEFFDAFGIKEGDPMWKSPADRAKIW